MTRTMILAAVAALAACASTSVAPTKPVTAVAAVPLGARIEALGPVWGTWGPQVERVLGEIPHVQKTHWDWQNAYAYLRFDKDGYPSDDEIREAFDIGTMFTSGDILYYKSETELPDALR